MPSNQTTPARLWNRDFLLLWQGVAESKLGSVLYAIGIGVWVYDRTDSAALMGLMTSFSYFGALVLQPLGGVLADRCRKRTLIAGSDLVCGVVMLALGALAWQGSMQVWQVLAVAAVSAVCASVLQPAVNSLLPQVTPPGELMRGMSLINGTLNALQMLGNAAGGFFVAFFGVPALIVFNGLTFLFSSCTEWFIRAGRTPAAGAQANGAPGAFWGELIGGVRYLRGQPGVARIVLAGAAVNLACAGFTGIVYVWCLEKGMTVPQYGLFLSAESAAMLAGLAVLAVRPIPARRRWGVLVATVTVQSVLYIAAMAAHGFWACTLLYAANAFFNAISNSFMFPAVAAATDPAYHGRVLSLLTALCGGGVAFSMLAYGALADVFGAAAVSFGGALLTVLPYAVFTLDPGMRRLLARET